MKLSKTQLEILAQLRSGEVIRVASPSVFATGRIGERVVHFTTIRKLQIEGVIDYVRRGTNGHWKIAKEARRSDAKEI